MDEISRRQPPPRSNDKTLIKRFLLDLEANHQNWTMLAPLPGETQPAALEMAVNTAVHQHGLGVATLAAFNRTFGLQLRNYQLQRPVHPQHTALMNLMPPTTTSLHRLAIGRFLHHVERLGLTWNDLVPQPGMLRPPLLETLVNISPNLSGDTRAALNVTYGMGLRAASGRVNLAPVDPVHQNRMQALDGQNVTAHQRSRINRLFCHLEMLGTNWDALRPDRNDPRPLLLEATINAAVAMHQLPTGTRGVVNAVYNLQLQ
jgi:hypothetical protein